jgi:2-dehydro-3-deoxyphosphogluconate aldolase / (4S)-4-hydroxy-2-oxoglutarate aldolase
MMFCRPRKANTNRMTRKDVCARIKEIGILPGIRVPAADDALFAAQEMFSSGIPVVELTMTVPGAIGVISELSRNFPQLIIGAGTVLNIETARACLDAGAAFITSPGLDLEIVGFTVRNDIASIPGALTPSEIMAALKAGADMIKIFPCAQVGGPDYIKALRSPFPQASFVASGGVNQQTAGDFIRAGASALGIRGELIPPAAVERRDRNWIHELAARFLGIVHRARAEFAPHG